MEKDSFKTIKSFCLFELKTQKSCFIAQAFPFVNPEEFSNIHSAVKKKYFDSAHNPFAYRVGLGNVQFRFNDDGEPSGSAGKPILDAIDKYDLTDIIIFVSRYFGGVKLGVGGLKRAFFDTAEGCLQNAKIITKYIKKKINLEFEYFYMGSIMNFLENNGITSIKSSFDTNVKIECEIRISKIEDFKKKLTELSNGKIKID